MPYQNVPDNLQDKMHRCVMQLQDGGEYDEQAAIAICYASVVEGKTDAANMAGKAGFILNPQLFAVKAVGDWELDVLAVPFHTKDADQQWFDESTDVMPDTFQTPLVVYQHGIKQGAEGFQDKPIKLGNVIAGSLKKMADGWHIRVVLDKAIKQAQDIWEAAKRGAVAVSSGSISHLARLNVGGKNIMYEKNRPGRISVWALAEVSLWELGNGNVKPANSMAYALPLGAMKAIYRDAGIPFPEVSKITDGVLPEAQSAAKRARNLEIIEKSKKLLSKMDKGN